MSNVININSVDSNNLKIQISEVNQISNKAVDLARNSMIIGETESQEYFIMMKRLSTEYSKYLTNQLEIFERI